MEKLSYNPALTYCAILCLGDKANEIVNWINDTATEQLDTTSSFIRALVINEGAQWED